MVTGPSDQNREKKHVLIVDDNPDNLGLLLSILPEQLYAVHAATSGEGALRIVDVTLPDLILLDIMMPGMDGYQVCNHLKEQPRTRDIPVIFISAIDQIVDKAKAFAQGGVDYITKPFQSEEVLMRVEAHLGLRSQQQRLQERIDERTAEVAKLNARLEQEVAERKQLHSRLTGLESVSPASIIESRLTPPGSERLLPIPRLENKFDAACACRVVSLVAPAGYGKSTTLTRLRSLMASRKIPCAWLSLDSEVNDDAHFLQYLLATFQHALPAVGPFASSGPPIHLSTALSALSEDLSDLGDIALFLDDFHLMESKSIHAMMNWFIMYGPPNLRFFISSRTALPLRLSRLRLSNAVYEFTMADLSLHLEEVGPFVTTVSDHKLGSTQINLLHRSTEGWPAGLQLAALALKNGEDVTEFVEEFSGRDKDVIAYIGEIVLARTPDKLVEFLSSTALFERFSHELCKTLLPDEDPLELIQQVQARNLFLISIDREHRWFRYHPLFADYLKSRFMLRSPDQVNRLYGRGSQWFEGQGLVHEAIRYALAGNDFERAVDLVAKSAFEMIQRRGDHATLIDWIKLLPAQYIERRPQVRLAYAWSLIFTHRFAEADAEIAILERGAGLVAVSGKSRQEALPDNLVLQKLRIVRGTYFGLTDQLARAEPLCTEWLARSGKTNSMNVGSAQFVLGYVAHLRHDYASARRQYLGVKILYERAQSDYGLAWVAALSAVTALEEGDALEAERILVPACEAATKTLGQHAQSTAMLALLLSRVRYEQNRIGEAEKILNEALVAASGHGVVETIFAGCFTKARLLVLTGLADQADAWLCEAISAANRVHLLRLSRDLELERIAIYLANGQVDRARQAFSSVCTVYAGEINADDAIELHTIEIRLQLASRQTERSQIFLNKLLANARSQGRNFHVVKLLCLKAILQADRGTRDEAMRTLDEALAIGMAGGLCRVFVDEGARIGELLRQMAERREVLQKGASPDPDLVYLHRIVNAFGNNADGQILVLPTTPAADPLRKEDFSERELEILKLVASGLGNRDLAARLFLSEATVKWHLHNVYVKLNVSNRSSAVARARALLQG